MSDVKGNPHLLVISPYFVPRKRVGALRSYKFVKYLNKLDWSLDVVYLDTNKLHLSDDESHHLSGVRLHALNVPFDRTTKQSGSDLSQARDTNVSPEKRLKPPKKSTSVQTMIDYLERFLPLDTWFPLLRYHYSKVEQVIRKHKPQAIWVTADPWSGLVLASRMAKRSDLPLILDLRDPFTLCPVRSKKKAKWVRYIEHILEKSIFEQAVYIVFTARETLEMYQKHYPALKDKMRVIHNAYDATQPRISDVTSNITSGTENSGDYRDNPLSKDYFKMVFLGKFRSSSPIDPIINLFERIRERHPDVFSDVRLYHIGELEGDILDRLLHTKMDQHFIPMNALPYHEVPKMLADFEGLVSILNPNRDMVIPSKFWDYLPAQAPIISIGGNSEMADILTKTGRGQQFKSNELDLLTMHIYHLWKEWTTKKDQKDVEEPASHHTSPNQVNDVFNDPNHPLYLYHALSKTNELSSLLVEAIEEHNRIPIPSKR